MKQVLFGNSTKIEKTLVSLPYRNYSIWTKLLYEQQTFNQSINIIKCSYEIHSKQSKNETSYGIIRFLSDMSLRTTNNTNTVNYKTNDLLAIDKVSDQYVFTTSKTLSDENYYFILTYDGLLYNIKYDVYLYTSGTYTITISNVKPTEKQNKWFITEPQFSHNNKYSLSIWNSTSKYPFDMGGDETLIEDTPQKRESRQLRMLEYEYKWFSTPFGDKWYLQKDRLYNNIKIDTCDSITGSTPFNRCNYRGDKACDSKHITRVATNTYCIWNGWNVDDKELCILGNIQNNTKVFTINNDTSQVFPKLESRLDAEKCKLIRNTTFGGYTYNTKENDNQDFEAWGPWTYSSVNQNFISKPILEFMTQHDTVENKPFFLSETFENTCGKVYRLSSNTLNIKYDISKRYIEKYPLTPEKTTICTYPGLDLVKFCDETAIDQCTGYNLERDVCYNMCYNSGGKCNLNIKQYCSNILDDKINIFDTREDNNLTPEQKQLVSRRRELCGCHMPIDFYKKFYDDVEQKSGITVPNRNPECSFPYCVSNTTFKSQTVKCPDTITCINISNITIDGKAIDTNIDIKQSTNCGITPGPTPTPQPSPTPGPNPQPIPVPTPTDTELSDKYFCKGNNLKLDRCIEYCDTNDCKDNLLEYCKTIYNTNIEPDITTKQICGNYLSTDFYRKLASDIKEKVVFKQSFEDRCLHEYYKDKDLKCPVETQCIDNTQLNVDNNGYVKGKVVILKVPVCSNVKYKTQDKTEDNTTTQKKFYEETWFWVVIAITIVIIVVLAIVLSTRNKK